MTAPWTPKVIIKKKKEKMLSILKKKEKKRPNPSKKERKAKLGVAIKEFNDDLINLVKI